MTETDLKLAFGSVEDRARAGDHTPRDRIALRNHIAEVEIGAFQQERGHTQRVRFNVVVDVSGADVPLADDVDRVLSYDTIVEAIALALSEERLNLLETLAERVAGLVLAAPQATRAYVRVEKLDLGPHALGVEIVRDRAGIAVEEVPAPAPLIVFLPNHVVHAPDLPRLIDQLQDQTAPVILCVGPTDLDLPQSASGPAQRRIDLLAIEQNAWVLAGRDARCVVVDSRTELDWAARQKQTTVWAPSKMVLDAAQRPAGDARALALWLAGELGALALAYVGEDPPLGLDLPTRRLDLTA